MAQDHDARLVELVDELGGDGFGVVPPAAAAGDAGTDRRRADRGDRRRAARADRDPDEPAQRGAGPAVVDTGGGRRAADPEGAGGVVLPVAAGAAPAGRPGAVGGDHDRLHHRHLDPQGRRPGPGAGCRLRGVEVDGVTDLRRDRRGGRRVPHPPPRPHRVPLRVSRRHLRQGPQQPPDRLPGGRRGHRVSPSTATARCSASTSATPRTRCSGRRSSAGSATAACTGSAW